MAAVINEDVKARLNVVLHAKYLGQNERYPAGSCREILTAFPDTESGNYWLINPDGRVFQAYCEMNLTCGPFNNITGWRRIANIDLDNLTQECPEGNFRLVPGSNRYCVRTTNFGSGCEASTFSVEGIPYTEVCGRASGIQVGRVNGFLEPNPDNNTETRIDTVYTDGISLTYGNFQNHLWTFAATMSEITTTCPCSDGSAHNTPSFVGSDYFCESGSTTAEVDHVAYPNDLLWDGEQCRNVEEDCCTGDFRPPWFYRILEGSQLSDIEMRICLDEGGDEDVGLRALELYVQ